MNCRVCNQPLSLLLTLEDMPGRAQHLNDVPIEDKVTLDICQCQGCGLVQLRNEPVWYWRESIRTPNAEQDARIESMREGHQFMSIMELEHQPDPNEYLRQFSGRGVVEVPNFGMFYDYNLFHEFMLDHLLYFTEETLRFTLQYNGFEVLSICHVWDNFILSAEVKRREPLQMYGFVEQIDRIKRQLDSFCAKYDRVAIYGASHEAFAVIALCHPKVAFMVDDSPEKQGKCVPVGGLMIHHPIALYNPYGLYDYGEHNKYGLPSNAVIIMGGGYSQKILDQLDFDGGVAILRHWGLEVVK